MIAVAVDSGWREDLGQPIQELEGGEAERGTAGQIGPPEEVQDLVKAADDEVEAVEGGSGGAPSCGSCAGGAPGARG